MELKPARADLRVMNTVPGPATRNMSQTSIQASKRAFRKAIKQKLKAVPESIIQSECEQDTPKPTELRFESSCSPVTQLQR